MPLAFQSTSHGEIAFGFFNIDGDLLLLEQSFFFADEFCRAVSLLARLESDEALSMALPGFTIDRGEDVGDLMGAIHGVHHTGFIGEVYRRYPFPERPEDFKQKTRGYETRDEFRRLIEPWSQEAGITLSARPDPAEVVIGELRFTPEVFRDLVRYVLRGGWPRWENDEPPEYVLAMQTAVTEGANWATSGLIEGGGEG